MYHGQSTDGFGWDANITPRQPGSLSMENFRFLFDDQIIADLEESDMSFQKLQAMNFLTFAASPNQTGVVDELIALVRSEILVLDNRGIPSLAKAWSTKVDLLLLDEMCERTGVRADPKGKFAVAEKIRKKLDRKWTRTPEGWAIKDDPQNIIFGHVEFDEWRLAFEDKQQTMLECNAGVNRFSS